MFAETGGNVQKRSGKKRRNFVLSSWMASVPFPASSYPAPSSFLPPYSAPHPSFILPSSSDCTGNRWRWSSNVIRLNQTFPSSSSRYGRNFCVHAVSVLYLLRCSRNRPAATILYLENRGNPRQAQSDRARPRRRSFIESSEQQISLIACFTRRFLSFCPHRRWIRRVRRSARVLFRIHIDLLYVRATTAPVFYDTSDSRCTRKRREIFSSMNSVDDLKSILPSSII